MFNPGEIISEKGHKIDCIYFVARGIIIEKNGKLEDFEVPQIKYNRGQIVAL